MTVKVNATTMRKDFQRVQAAIAKTPIHLRKEMQRKATLAVATNVFVRPLRQIAPKRTGALRRSIRVSTRRHADGIDVIYGSRKAFYAKFLEFGFMHKGWGKKRRWWGARRVKKTWVSKFENLARRKTYSQREVFYAHIRNILGVKVVPKVRSRI